MKLEKNVEYVLKRQKLKKKQKANHTFKIRIFNDVSIDKYNIILVPTKDNGSTGCQKLTQSTTKLSFKH